MSLPRRLKIIGTADEIEHITALGDHRHDQLLTAQEVAARLACNPATVYAMAQRGALPVVRFAGSRLLRFSGRALDALIARGGSDPWR